jgi:hypothetical protein
MKAITAFSILAAALLPFGCSGEKQQQGAQSDATQEQKTEKAKFNKDSIKFAAKVFSDDVLGAIDGSYKSFTKKDFAMQLAGIDSEVTASKINNDYQENEIAADQKYNGKRIIIRGKIKAISKNAFDNGYFVLNTGKPFQEMNAELTKDATVKAASIKKGSNVILVCERTSFVIGSVVAGKCVTLYDYMMGDDRGGDNVLTYVSEFFKGERTLQESQAMVMAWAYYLAEKLPIDHPCLTRFVNCGSPEVGKITDPQEFKDEAKRILTTLRVVPDEAKK